MSNLAVQPIRRSSKLGCFLGTVAIFALLGPPIGGFVAWLGGTTYAIAKGAMATAPLITIFAMLVMMLVFAYPAGIYFALVAGVIVAATGIWGHRNGIIVPVVAAVIASVAVVLAMKFLSFPESDVPKILGIFPICLTASVACWFITREIVRSAWLPAS